MTIGSTSTLRGGEWLVRASDPVSVFTPERLTDEQRLVARTVSDFVAGDVRPSIDGLERKDWELSRQLVRRAAGLGLLSADIAEADGGEGLDKITSMVISERMGPSASFAVTFGAQVNLTILPLVLFGNDDQRARYLPRLMSGELIGAYCLSESGSGSDALGARTRATRAADGGFVLNGEKMWTSNGGFADLFIVFAKVDGEHFTAFIVERAAGGVVSGKEEHKMGLHGSSTTAVILQDAKVPAANVLGEIGRGHKIAFNVLNFARFKLGAACCGTARVAIAEAAKYAATRRQFGQPIAAFGAIKHKLAEMVARQFAVESLLYRTAGLLEADIEAAPPGTGSAAAALASFEEHAIEASIAKVAATEMLDFVLDENIQIHGGNGYVRDYPAERHYRDARVNRIFEGTNEINRILIPTLFAKRLAGGPVASGSEHAAGGSSTLESQADVLDALKAAARDVLRTALSVHGAALAREQEVLILIADMAIAVYAAESASLRAEATAAAKIGTADLQRASASLVVERAAASVYAAAREAFAALLTGPQLGQALERLERLSRRAPVNTVDGARRIADATVARGGYLFDYD